MKIQFINALLGGDFSALDISLTNLATYIDERTKHSASILDFTFHTKHWKKHLHRNIKKEKPDMIGMSGNTMYMQYIKKIANEIKEHYDIPIILGGYHPSIKPTETLNIKTINAICIGDGEFALAKYMDKYEYGISAEGITGIWAKEKGKIIKNKIGCFNKNIDDLPIPNWDYWKDLDKYFYYLGMLYIIGNRGCPYHCTYCDAHGISKAVAGSYYRIRDPIDYAREIAYQWEKYKNRGVRLAQLFDQVFTMDKKWLKKFCDEYRRLGIADEFKYSTFARIDHLDKEKMEMLGKSGCALLRVGVEAGDKYVRNKIYGRNIDNQQIKKIFKLGEENNIGFTAFNIIGGPGETRETINKTIKLAVELDSPKIRFAFFIFKPFTEASTRQISEYGGYVDEKRWQKADNITFDAVVHLKDLTPKQVERLQRKAYFLTFGRRLIRMIKNQNLKYFTRLGTYMVRGIKDGLDPHYLLPYYHIYAYDNINK